MTYVFTEPRCRLASLDSASPGDCLTVLSSPFGIACPLMFINNVSKGVCSMLSSDATFCLTDARCPPGSEGGAVFLAWGTPAVRLVGIVAPTLAVLSAEGATGKTPLPDIAFVLSLSVALQTLVVIDHELSSGRDADGGGPSPCKPVPALGCLALALRPPATSPLPFTSVVLVKTRSSWGSGVVVHHTGVVVTCAHVVSDTSGLAIGVACPLTGTTLWLSCDVLFLGAGTLDLAILRVSAGDVRRVPSDLCVAPLANAGSVSDGLPGTAVFVVGFPLESTSLATATSSAHGNCMPIVTGGHLSSTVASRVRSREHMLHLSIAVPLLVPPQR
jgi:hypothetical protein